MCGIAGVLGFDPDVSVPRMVEALRHRGPDAQGSVARANACVGASRLRIVDLHAGDQPLVSARSGAVLVFNGEIYNHRELRERLKARSHRFETATDSEVVLRAYEEYGWRCVEHLDGMYAFAVVDGERAFLARDPLGIKPLHYSWLRSGRALAFASEIKALLRCPEVPAQLDEATLGDLRSLHYVADPSATLLRDVRSLPPGTCLELTLSQPDLAARLHPFADPLPAAPAEETLAAAEDRLDALLAAALRSHQIADVAICLTLSGGLDSTLLGLILREQVGERGVVSFAVGDSDDSEDLRQAERVAARLGFAHRTVRFGFDAYLAAIPAAIQASESLADGVSQYLLFREMSRDFRVALNGEGADELFGGYPEHRNAAQYVARIRDAALDVPLTERGAIEREALRAAAPADPDAWMLEHLAGAQLIDRHLHPLDKLSMASSVEVRVPYLDRHVAAYARRLPTGWKINRSLGSLKYILRRLYLRRWQRSGAAPELLDAVLRDKQGFPDARRDSKMRLDELCGRALPESYFSRHPRRPFLPDITHAFWLDLFEHIFCERRGAGAEEIDVLDFLAERADLGRARVAEIAASVTGRWEDDSPVARQPAAAPPGSAAVRERLAAIVAAVGGSDVRTDGRVLWFHADAARGVEIRLAADLAAPCYDRSANFTISYGAETADAPLPAGFAGALDRIKEVDASPLPGVTVVFAAAAGELAAALAGDASASRRA